MTKKHPVFLDCRGLACPQPVLAAKEALESGAGGLVEVLVDNQAAKSNLVRFGRSLGHKVTDSGEGFEIIVRIEKNEGKNSDKTSSEPDSCPCAPSPGGFIIIIPADRMGRGDEELGRVLMRAFTKTIRELSPLPAKIFFYNAGVKLTATDNDLIAPLAELAALGVEIYSCWTCLDFFHLEDSLKVGQVTNMYEIMAAMAGAAKVISPC